VYVPQTPSGNTWSVVPCPKLAWEHIEKTKAERTKAIGNKTDFDIFASQKNLWAISGSGSTPRL
jgi:hypothetical protein